jgi:hypothetical protein
MSEDQVVRNNSDNQIQSLPPSSVNSGELKQKALAIGLELSKRALETGTLDELFYVLTNDTRTLIAFDRAALVTHLGNSGFAAATNQPILQKKMDFYKRMNSLAGELKGIDKGIFLSADADSTQPLEQDLSKELRDRLFSYMAFTGSSFLLCVPLSHRKEILGHLLLEFYDKKIPNQIEILTLLSIAPFFASALSEKWLLRQKPGLETLISSRGRSTNRFEFRRVAAVAILILVALALFFGFPITETVGGDSEVLPRDRFLAFVRTDGLVERINVKEDSRVEKGQVLAILDPRDLDFEIKVAEKKFEILTQELMLLRRESGQEPSKLAESKLTELKRMSAWEELEYLKWKTRFLEIKAPVSGVVVTREVDTLVGKKFKAGEPFCEIAAPSDLWVIIYVPEDKIGLLQKAQIGTIYLNNEPGRPSQVHVAEIAPMAQAMPRLGNVYRVGATFVELPNYLKVGMKGIGKIHTGRSSLASIIGRRLLTRWNQLSIYL